jgi:hypothetical protein
MRIFLALPSTLGHCHSEKMCIEMPQTGRATERGRFPKKLKSAELGNLLIEVREGGFEGFSVVGICGYLEVVDDPNTGKLEVSAFLFPAQLVGGFWSSARRGAHSCFRFHLRLDIFALPTACHGNSLTHIR